MTSIEGKPFITVEGIDGCGKTTIAMFICEWLKSQGHEAIYTVEPTETWIGDDVKRGFSEGVNPFTEAFLFMADRADHTLRIRGWLSEGKTVVSDRYVDSTYAYQGAALLAQGMEDAVTWLKTASLPYILEPNITIFLAVDPERAMERISERPKRTKFEKLDFLINVDKVYRALSESEARFRTIDANRSLEDVEKDAVSILSSI